MSRSIVQGGPQPELSDLVLFLDAGNTFSYPGAGSVWYDLSGRGNHFNLNNSPTHNGTFFTFNGTNQWAACSNTTCGNFGTGSFTIEYGVNFSDRRTNTGCIIQKRANYISLGNNGQAGFIHRIGSNEFVVQDNLTNGTNSVTCINNGVSSLVTGSNYHIVQTITNTGAGTMTGRLYINGTLLNTSTYNYSLYNGNPSGSVDNTVNIVLMRTENIGTLLPGNLYFVRLYQKALAVPEVQQNWQTVRVLLGL